jgi:hypothetical protein
MLFVVYAWRDAHGMRIIDAFATYGPKLHGEQARVLTGLRAARLSLFVVEAHDVHRRQLGGREVLRNETITVLDQHAYETLGDQDALLAWMMPVGPVWRPFGVATHVQARKLPALMTALTTLARGLDLEVSALPTRAAAQTFWTAHRTANLGPA